MAQIKAQLEAAQSEAAAKSDESALNLAEADRLRAELEGAIQETDDLKVRRACARASCAFCADDEIGRRAWLKWRLAQTRPPS